MLLLPHPFGPTMALIPHGKGISSLSMKDLKPVMEIFLILIGTSRAGISPRQKDIEPIFIIHSKFPIDCKDLIQHPV
jgi:hypothetical protein